nr:tail tubular protein B [uncultured Mediterranean phage uvMED]
MPLVSGAIPNLINGVSQQPPSLRLPTQGDIQENGLSSVVRGLEKRPGTQHIAEVDSSFSDSSAFIHTIQRDEEEAYVAVLTDNSIKVFDLIGKYAPYHATNTTTAASGNEIPVYKNTNKDALTSTETDYLTVLSGNNAQETFGSTTVADYTFILNRTKTVTRSTSEYSHRRPYEAYVYVAGGDFKSTYTVNVSFVKSGTTYKFTASVKTPDGVVKSNTTANDTPSPVTTQLNNQEAAKTSNIAKSLATGSSGLTAGSNVITDLVITNALTHTNIRDATKWKVGTAYTADATEVAIGTEVDTFTVHYNTDENHIYIRSNSVDFDVTVSDGSGGTDITSFVGHKEVASFGKLPATLPKEAEYGFNGSTIAVGNDTNGFTIKVGGDTKEAQDDFYVYWNGKSWKETVKPRYTNVTDDEYKLKFNAETMPHQLRKAFDGDKVYFIFEQAPWKSRTVGDNDTNPFPSFTDFEINDVFFHRNRLGFLSDENVIFSEAGGFFNLFSTTTLTILDSEPIDVAVSNNQVSILRHAIPFNESLLIFSDLQQFKVSAGELLTPTSVSIDVSTNFEVDTRSKPVPAGRYVYFPFKRGSFSGVREYFLDISTETSDAQEVTAHVPEYIKGNIVQLASSSNEDILLALGNTDKKNLYVYKYFWSGSEKLQSSWSTWTFDGEVLSMSILGSDVFLLIKRSSKLYLEKLTLSTDPASLIMDDSQSVHLDRRVELKTGGLTSIPYADATGVQYVVETGKIITQSDVSAQLALSKSVFAGIPFTFKYRVSEQVYKQNEVTVEIARLQIRNMSFNYSETGFFEVVVTPLPSSGRVARTNTFSGVIVGSTVLNKQTLQSGTFRVPVLSKSDNVIIEIQNNKHLPSRLQSAEYEGFLVVRSPRG